MSELNERFVMTPIALLEIPEFVRNFDSKPIGSVYRVLCSRVWRKPKEALRPNSTKRIKLLTDLYEGGMLVSLYDLTDLSDAVGFDERSVRRSVKSLSELGLLTYEKIDGEHFYIVGETSLQGRSSVGVYTEALYLNRWRDFVNYANAYAPDMVPLFSEDLVSYFKSGDIEHGFLTKLTEIKTLDDFRSMFSEEEKEDETPVVVEASDFSDFDSYEKARVRQSLIHEASTMEDPYEAIQSVRTLLSDGVITLAESRSILHTYVPNKYRKYEKLPRLALKLEYFDENPNYKETTKLVQIWSAVHEDMAGNVYSSNQNDYKKMMGVAKKLLTSYHYEQILWTIKRLASELSNDLEFMTRGFQTVPHLVKKYSRIYHEMKEEELRLKKSRDTLLTKQEEKEPTAYDFEDPFGDDYKDTEARLITGLDG